MPWTGYGDKWSEPIWVRHRFSDKHFARKTLMYEVQASGLQKMPT